MIGKRITVPVVVLLALVVAGPVGAAAPELILWGDVVTFFGRSSPDNCVARSRFHHGESVGFRMTVVDPVNGEFVEDAEVIVRVSYGGRVEEVPMRYRGTGSNPRPGFWTAKWVVPDDAPVGIVDYSVTAVDNRGRSSTWEPFQIEASMLTIVEGVGNSG